MGLFYATSLAVFHSDTDFTYIGIKPVYDITADSTKMVLHKTTKSTPQTGSGPQFVLLALKMLL